MGAVKNFKPNSIDMIYIDAMHTYCDVMDELPGYWPILNCGGIMAGHDIVTAAEAKQRFGYDWSKCQNGTYKPESVKGAVEDFAKMQNISFVGITGDSVLERSPSYYFVKKC